MKALIAIVTILGFISGMISGASFMAIASADPLDVNSARVWVDPRVEEFAYIHDLIANQLDSADDITVSVEYTGPAYVKQDTTHVVAFVNNLDRSIAVYANTKSEWPDQKTAVAILSHSEEDRDMVTRILRFIREVHAWQAANPIRGQ